MGQEEPQKFPSLKSEPLKTKEFSFCAPKSLNTATNEHLTDKCKSEKDDERKEESEGAKSANEEV